MIGVIAAGYARLLTFCGYLAGGCIGLLALMITTDVAIRNFGLGNFPWLTEVAEYAIYGTTFLAAPWVLYQGAHVRVDVLVSNLPPAIASWINLLVDFTGLAISLTLLYFGFEAAWDSYQQGSLIFKELVIPEWWPLAVLPLSFALLSIEFMRRLVTSSRIGGGATAAPQSLTDGL